MNLDYFNVSRKDIDLSSRDFASLLDDHREIYIENYKLQDSAFRGYFIFKF